MLTLHCPSCSRLNRVIAGRPGQEALCKVCGGVIVLPKPVELAEDCGFELVEDSAAHGNQGMEEVGVVCDNCLKVFRAPAAGLAPCPRCGGIQKAPALDEVKKAAEAPPPRPAEPEPPPRAPAPAPAAVQPSTTWFQTSDDWAALLYAVVIAGSCLVVLAAVIFRPSETGESSRPPVTPSRDPLDRSSEEHRRGIRDQMIKQGTDPRDADEFTRELQKWEKKYPSR